MVTELHRLKEYKVETLYLSVSILDRYLAALGNIAPPNLLHLAVAAILMGAKLE